jgi:hypothetical protein
MFDLMCLFVGLCEVLWKKLQIYYTYDEDRTGRITEEMFCQVVCLCDPISHCLFLFQSSSPCHSIFPARCSISYHRFLMVEHCRE